MNLLLMGPPGAGKGTLAAKIVDSLNIPHISTGDMLRSAVKAGSELGRQVEAIMNEGRLVGDALMIDLIKEKIAQDCPQGFVLDGFPRTQAQAQALNEVLKIDSAIYLKVSDETVIKRLSGRRTSPKTGRVYNIYFDKPKLQGRCDDTGAPLTQREDDKPETVNKRLAIFHSTMDAVLAYYKTMGLLNTIDGEQAPAAVKEIALNIIYSLKA